MKNNKINVVLFEPEIAGNVGSIMRTCVATNSILHLIEPLGFFLDDRFVKRASANYIDNLIYYLYDNLEDFFNKNKNLKYIFYSTRYGLKPHTAINFKKIPLNQPIYIMHGKESTGIPKWLLKENLNKCFRLPMSNKVRSLNVSNVVAIVNYEILRQLDYLDLSKYEIQKTKNFLINNDFKK